MIAEKTTRETVPTEHQEQGRLFKWAQDNEWKWGGALRVMFAIPNGGLRDERNAINLKREGVRRGVPDVCLPVARGGFHALYIEMKRTKGGSVSDSQRDWHLWLADEGNLVAVCYGVDQAKQVITEYLNK